MKKLLFFCLILASISGSAQSAEINTLSAEEQKEGWKLLFNGQNLDGWHNFNTDQIEGWKIIDGLLTNSGVGSDHGGDLVTNDKYSDFDLQLEWEIASQSNSGIFYHVEEGKTAAIYESGPEYQLIDDRGWPDSLEEWQHTGANYGMNPPVNAPVKPANEWNQSRIVVQGSHVRHYLNGLLVVDYQLWDRDWKEHKQHGKWKDAPYYGQAKTGLIGLQDHGGLTLFRNIKIKEL